MIRMMILDISSERQKAFSTGIADTRISVDNDEHIEEMKKIIAVRLLPPEEVINEMGTIKEEAGTQLMIIYEADERVNYYE